MLKLDPGLRIVTYARVSSDAQNVTNSIDTQMSRMEDSINRAGATHVAHYQDEAKSGKYDDRSSFQRMITDVKRKPRWADAILAVNTSRFARNNFDSTFYKHELRKHGIQVLFIDLPNDGSPEAALMENIMQAFDAFMSDLQSRNIRYGNLNVVKEGYYLPRRPPYGFDLEIVEVGGRPRRKLIINEYQAAIVQKLFDTYESGTGSQDLHKMLNDLGIPSPTGGKWGKGKIYSMLRDPVYKGTMIFPEEPQTRARTAPHRRQPPGNNLSRAVSPRPRHLGFANPTGRQSPANRQPPADRQTGQMQPMRRHDGRAPIERQPIPLLHLPHSPRADPCGLRLSAPPSRGNGPTHHERGPRRHPHRVQRP